MDFDSYKELIQLVRETPRDISVVLSFAPSVTDADSNEEYPVMVVTNITDPALITAMTQMLDNSCDG